MGYVEYFGPLFGSFHFLINFLHINILVTKATHLRMKSPGQFFRKWQAFKLWFLKWFWAFSKTNLITEGKEIYESDAVYLDQELDLYCEYLVGFDQAHWEKNKTKLFLQQRKNRIFRHLSVTLGRRPGETNYLLP